MKKGKNRNGKQNSKNYPNNANSITRKEANKMNSEIPNYRMIMFTYYKNPYILKIEQKDKFNFIGINNLNNDQRPQNYITTNKLSGYTNFKENINNTMSDKELYERFGKYNTYYDSNNKLVFYNDKNLYNRRSKENVPNFEFSTVGLANIGNSCYMNAFLQILLHTPNFLNNLHTYKIYEFEEDTLIYNLGYLSQYPFDTKYLHNIKKIMKEINPQYGTFSPGDSQIFAVDFIDKLISECKGEDNSINDSYESNYNDYKISKKEKYSNFLKEFNLKEERLEIIFQFTEISIGKETYNYSFSTNLNIELIFPQNNENFITLNKLLEEKYLINTEALNNKKIVKSKKRTQIADIPEILIISFDRGVTGKRVIKTNVSFSDNLNIDPYIDQELKKYNDINCTNYILYGINERYGQSKSQGHYVSYIKIKNKDWFRFSDLYVIKCNPSFNSSDVFGLYYVRKDCLSQ